MPRIACLTAVVVALFASACADLASPLDPDLDELEPGGEPVAISALEHPHSRFYSGITEQERIVVEDQVEWEQVWARLWRNTSPVPDTPPVDFAREFVIVAAMGTRPSGGYSIRVDEARAYAGHVTVHVVETSPGRGCVVTMAITAPVDVVKIPRTPLEVRFRTSKTVHECR